MISIGSPVQTTNVGEPWVWYRTHPDVGGGPCPPRLIAARGRAWLQPRSSRAGRPLCYHFAHARSTTTRHHLRKQARAVHLGNRLGAALPAFAALGAWLAARAATPVRCHHRPRRARVPERAGLGAVESSHGRARLPRAARRLLLHGEDRARGARYRQPVHAPLRRHARF